jgi:CRP/FNR family transcriptional regulator, cyclic AMP receptor protein
MQMPITAELLRLVPLFNGMTDRSFEAIANLASETDFATGDELVRQGTPGDSFIIVVNGRAIVERDGRRLRELGPGDFLGEIALIDGSPRTATVTALDPIHAFVIGREGFLQLIDRIPVFRLEVLNALTERIRATVLDPLA